MLVTATGQTLQTTMPAPSGGGYSASGSNANATPQGTQSNTVFNFNSAGTSFDGGTQSLTATPTSTAAAGGSSAASTNPNSRNPAVSGLQFITDNPVATISVVAVLAIGVGLFIYFKTR